MTQRGAKKSHTGCNHCKRRKVKCDERLPCSSCARRGEFCSLLYPSTDDKNSSCSSTIDRAEWIRDLELMHHFCRRTSQTSIGGRPHDTKVWSEYIFTEALKHHFLMHSILAITSLHLAWGSQSDSQRDKYIEMSDKHQATALESSKVAVANITNEIGPALLAFASITSLSSVARACLKTKTTARTRYYDFDALTECLTLSRGIREILAATFSTIMSSPMGTGLTGYELQSNVRVILPVCIVESITTLRRLLSEHCNNPVDHALCSDAINSLQLVYRNILYFSATDRLSFGHIWRWTTLVDTDFIRLLRDHYQPALIITAHFTICCHLVRSEWFLGDWGRYTFEAIVPAVLPELQHYLNWPREQFAFDCHSFRRGDAIIEECDVNICRNSADHGLQNSGRQ